MDTRKSRLVTPASNVYFSGNEQDQRSSEFKEALSETNLSNTPSAASLLTSKTSSNSSDQHFMIETPNHTNAYQAQHDAQLYLQNLELKQRIMQNLHQKAQINPFVNALLSHNNNNQYCQIQAPVMMRPAQSYFPANQMLMNNLINQNATHELLQIWTGSHVLSDAFL